MLILLKFLIIILSCFYFTCVNSQSLSCVVCDTKNESEETCGSTPDTTKLSQCAENLGCFTRIYYSNETDQDVPGWYTERGCAVTGMTCDNSNCKMCTTSACNNEVFPLNRNKCLKYISGGDTNTKSDYCNVYGSNDCITFYDDDGKVLLKDCYLDIPMPTRELCDQNDYYECNKCTGENCNTDTKRASTKCYSCQGVDCLDPLQSNALIVDCLSDCYIGIDANGLIVRGCSTELMDTSSCTKNPQITSSCFLCNQDNCNAIIYPQTGRLQCHTCTGTNCEATEDNVEYCADCSANEKCVSYFSSSQDVLEQRGCLSSLSDDIKNECKLNGSSNCLTCTYDKCNKDVSKVFTEYCIACNSIDDPSCVNNNVITEVRCQSSSCYTKLIEFDDFGQHLERGCYTNDIECSDTNTCVSCQGRSCNNKLFPSQRISCHYCAYGDCKDNLKSKTCNKFITNEACLTFYGEDNEVIYRDCYADSPKETRDICDDSNSIECSKCTGSLCNKDNQRRGTKCFKCEGVSCFNPSLAYVIDCASDCYMGINDKGETVRDCSNVKFCNSTFDPTCLTCNSDFCNAIVHPITNRLSCLKCIGSNCNNDNLHSLSEFCEVFSSQETCVSIFGPLNTVIERGCSSAVENIKQCTDNPGSCINCGLNNCNTQTSLAETNYCVSCNSQYDDNCISTSTSPKIKACSTNSCYSRLIGTSMWQNIEKGCSADLTSQCTNGSCSTCVGNLCNNIVYPTDRYTCNYCVGDDCKSSLTTTVKYCNAYNNQNQACITFFDEKNEVNYRDCYSDAATGTQEVCDDESELMCTKCKSGKNCNTQTARRGVKCFKCEGLSCFNQVNYPADVVDCSSSCYVGINSKGETVRDCTGSKTCNSTDATCMTCNSDFCNDVAHPITNRLSCLKCVGAKCSNNLDSLSEFCEVFSSQETCVSIFGPSNTVIERGCSSAVENKQRCTENPGSCINCGLNNCNTQTSLAETYYCVSCNSQYDDNCISTSTSPRIKACSTNSCYSRLIGTSTWQNIEKGCSADLTSQCTNGNCSTCVGDICNNIVYPTDRYTCNYCIGADCRSNLTTTVKYCNAYNNQNQACITFFDEKNEVNYRDCYSDAAVGTQNICDDESELMCTKCKSGKNCNNHTKARGLKCFKCEGLACFQVNYPADVIDCTMKCYNGVNKNGESVRGCTSDDKNSDLPIITLCENDFCNGIEYPMENRLSCYKCIGLGCAATTSDYCESYGNENCVTVFDSSSHIIERGCSKSVINKKYCDQNYKNCKKCSTDNCNDITSMKVNCISCNSATNSNCVTNPASVSTIAQCDQGCFIKIIGEDLVRGCLEDLAGAICTENEMCSKCSELDKCNSQLFPSNRLRCLSCNNSTCRETISNLCIKYRNDDKCVTLFNEYTPITKGCLADLATVNQQICSSQTPLCTTCSTINCNVDSIRKDENCIVCNSNNDPNCSQKPLILPKSRCHDVSDGKCFVKILDDGVTERGCKGKLTTQDQNSCTDNSLDSTCLISAGEASNYRIVPENRLRCFTCDSLTDENCVEIQTNLLHILPCRNFVKPEKCLKISYANGRVIRGCEADHPNVCDTEKCETCSDKNGCNDSADHSTDNSTRNKFQLFTVFLSIFVTILVKFN